MCVLYKYIIYDTVCYFKAFVFLIKMTYFKLYVCKPVWVAQYNVIMLEHIIFDIECYL